jgi:hypothetical protein
LSLTVRVPADGGDQHHAQISSAAHPTHELAGVDRQQQEHVTQTALVQLASGAELIVRGSPWRRDFTVIDQDARTVLSAAPQTSAVSPRQHDYAVHQSTPGALRRPR